MRLLPESDLPLYYKQKIAKVLNCLIVKIPKEKHPLVAKKADGKTMQFYAYDRKKTF